MKPSIFTVIILFISSVAFSQAGLKQTGIVISAYFEKGKWEIINRQEVEKELDDAKSKYRKIALYTKGFTDTIGSTQYNIYLADFRLNAVREMTQGLKIETRNKEIIGESSEKSMAENRRVDIYVLTPEDKVIKPEPPPVAIEPVAEIIEPVAEEVPAQKPAAPALNIPIQTNIEFEEGTEIIKRYSNQNVETIFNVLSDYPEYKIELHGHVCCGDNYELSYQRAVAVKQALIRKGIDRTRIVVRGFSNSEPLVPETDEASKQRNRRVEVIYTKKK